MQNKSENLIGNRNLTGHGANASSDLIFSLIRMTSAENQSEELFDSFGNFNHSNSVTIVESVINPAIRYSSPVTVFIALIIFSVCIIFGNSLVIIAVVRENYLKSPPNYFVASLAAADLFVGVLLVPFEAVTQLLDRHWIFGPIWCDLWHSFDVLLSTASILNLCVISLDRYWAICTPFRYPRRMNSRVAYRFIALVWILASLISFPAIFWWRSVRKEPIPPGTCPFTEDVTYLVASSCISFYIPLAVMLFAYYKIYVAAVKQSKSIRQGTRLFSSSESVKGGRKEKPVSCNGDVLSQDRKSFSVGDCRVPGDTTSNQNDASSFLPVGNRHKRTISERFHRRRPSFSRRPQKPSPNRTGVQTDFPSEVSTGSGADVFQTSSVDERRPSFFSMSGSPAQREASNGFSFRRSTRRSFTVARKLARFAKEKKAAKTLGIIFGVFIICWFPFFLLNILFALCSHCAEGHVILFEVVTWLGWMNSAVNVIIYACWSQDFRRAFVKLLCCDNTHCVDKRYYRARRRSSTCPRRLSVV